MALGVAALVAAAAVLWFAYALFVDRSHPARATTVIVPRGSAFSQIAAELSRTGVIGSPVPLRLYAKLRHEDTHVRAGEYRFKAHLTPAAVLAELLGGGAQIAKWVTFPEGFTAKQMAHRLQSEGFGDWRRFYRAFMHDTIVVDGTRTKNLEGFLFPSTYLIPIGATPRTVEGIMTAQFFKELPPDAAARAKALHLSVPQVVTVASLVQQEGKADDERPLIAGVIYNRLRKHMLLQIDAALEYTFPEHKTVIFDKDLQTDSPYNLYKHEGLPPTPIANPGEPSLLAAFEPQKSNYLYYVYKGNGHHAFATTLTAQLANERKYLK